MGNLNISGATFGYDIEGTRNYLNELKAGYIDAAAKDARDLSAIDAAIDATWVGQAADDFKTALNKDANDLSKALEEIYEQLEKQINDISASIADHDAGLMAELRK